MDYIDLTPGSLKAEGFEVETSCDGPLRNLLETASTPPIHKLQKSFRNLLQR